MSSEASDLRATLEVVVGDMSRTDFSGRISLSLPDEPVMSAVDPDAVGILCRNLVENALRHGSQSSPVEVALSGDGILTVAEAASGYPSSQRSPTAWAAR